MNTRNKGAILLALAVSLGMFGARPASAQMESPLVTLQRPVPDLQQFSSDMTTLTRELYYMSANHPEVQSRAAELEQKLASLTPDELTILANAYDRPALSRVVERLRPLVPESGVTTPLAVPTRPSAERTGPLAVAARPSAEATAPAQYPISPLTTALVTANYDVCTPGPDAMYRTVGPPIPSDMSTQYGGFVALVVLQEAQVPLDYACHSITEVLGEGSNLPWCVAAGIADFLLVTSEAVFEGFQFCDPYVLSAENDATYSNTFAIFNNLATTRNDIDNNFATTESQISSVNSNLTNVGLALTSNLLQAQADLDAHLNKVDADVTAGTTQVDSNIATLQALEIRIEIERSLALEITVGLFETPKAQGGYLEVVGTTVQTVINGLAAAGQNVDNAQRYLNLGNTRFAAGLYKIAYHDYLLAYRIAVR